MTSQDVAAAGSPGAAPRKTRPYYWSVKRELWENAAIWMAPLGVASLALLGFAVHTLMHLPAALTRAETTITVARTISPANVDAFAAAGRASVRAAGALEMPYDVIAGVTFMTTVVVAFFYCLGALHGERRDRTILFWKSLPVSDLTSVLAKATLPLIVAPVVIFVIAFVAQLIMLGLSSLVLVLSGHSVGTLMGYIPVPFIWPAMARGMIILALWYAPVVGWLLLVSAWAKRTPILWALGPWAAIAAIEWFAFRSMGVIGVLMGRLGGGFTQAFTPGGTGKGVISEDAHLDPTHVLVNPQLWIGLVNLSACQAR